MNVNKRSSRRSQPSSIRKIKTNEWVKAAITTLRNPTNGSENISYYIH